MSNTYTSKFGYSKPAEGDLDWDTTLNGNFDAIDADLGFEHNGNGSHGNDLPLRCQIAADQSGQDGLTPRTGDMLWRSDEKMFYVYDGSAWQSWESQVSVLNNVPMQTQTLTYAATIEWNLNQGGAATVTLTGNATLQNPTNMKDGTTHYLIVKQDSTGNRTLSYDTNYKFPGGKVPELSTGPNAVDILTFLCDGTNMYCVSQQDFK